jgi:hypothetical protein
MHETDQPFDKMMTAANTPAASARMLYLPPCLNNSHYSTVNVIKLSNAQTSEVLCGPCTTEIYNPMQRSLYPHEALLETSEVLS